MDRFKPLKLIKFFDSLLFRKVLDAAETGPTSVEYSICRSTVNLFFVYVLVSRWGRILAQPLAFLTALSYFARVNLASFLRTFNTEIWFWLLSLRRIGANRLMKPNNWVVIWELALGLELGYRNCLLTMRWSHVSSGFRTHFFFWVW